MRRRSRSFSVRCLPFGDPLPSRSMVSIRAGDLADARRLAPDLRKTDLLEIQASTGEDPLAVLLEGVRRSAPCYAATDEEGALLAIFGVVPPRLADDAPMAWLLGTDELAARPLSFVRLSRRWVDRLQQGYPALYSCVDARNSTHVRWLEWCGFTLVETIAEYGVERRPFHVLVRGTRSNGC